MSSKKKKKKKKTQLSLIIIVLAAVAVICAAVVWMNSGPNQTVADQTRFFSISDANGAAIILNSELQEECGICVDGVVYVPYDMVQEKIESGFYLEDGTLYRTLPSENNSWTVGDGTGFLYQNSSGDCYLSSDLLAQYADLEVGVFDEPHRVVIRSSWDGVETVTVTEDTQIRVMPDEHSEIAVEAPAGKTVILLEKGEDWSRVSTADGHTGHIRTEKLSPEAVPLTHEADPRFSFEHLTFPGRIKMVWHYIDSIENNGYLPGMLADTKDLNVIAPTWFVLGDAQGNLISYADEVYAGRARDEYGLSLWAMISDYTGEDSSTGEILSNTENRRNIITQMMDMALTYGLEGFNIDFETITSDQAPAFLQFLRELTSAAHAEGIYVSVDNYVPLYTRYYRRDEQARIVDYLFIMGYDEHTGRSPEIGSVASLPFVEEGVTDTLEEAPAEQVVLGVPFFTRGWTEPFGSAEFESQWLDMTEIEGWVQEHGITLNWDPTMGQYTGSADGADARYTIWSEDARSLGEKLKLIEKYGLAGACAWRVGIETADVWDTWQTILQ